MRKFFYIIKIKRQNFFVQLQTFFVNLQLARKNLKGYFVPKKIVLNAGFKICDMQIQISLRFGMANSIKTHLSKKFSTQHEYLS